MAGEHDELMIDFVNEINQMLDEVETGDKGVSDDPDALAGSFRLFHSIKGGSGFLGLDRLARVAAAAESHIGRIQSGNLQPGPETGELIDRCLRYFRRAIKVILVAGDDTGLEQDTRELLDWIRERTGIDQADASGQSDRQGLDSFLRETEELLRYAEQEFVLWEDTIADEERLLTLYRVLHRLGTNYRFYGYHDLVRLSEAMERLLDRAISGEVFRGEYPEKPFLRAIDVMIALLEPLSLGDDGEVADLDHLITDLENTMREPLGELLVKAGLVEPDVVDRALETQRRDRSRSETPRRLGEVLVEMGEVTPDQVNRALSVQEKSSPPEKIDRDRQQRLAAADTLLSGEKEREGQSHLARIRILAAALRQALDHHADELPPIVRQTGEELVAAVRGLDRTTLGPLVPRLARLVHDLAERTGKRVRFQVVGDDVELEFSLLERLTEPLCHLLRNSVDHGIETPLERQAAGKEPRGRLILSLLRKSDGIWISVEDDGRGLDIDTITRKALEHELIDEQDIPLDGRQIAALIFRLGFTTAERVTETSGRGIGMDLVKKTVKSLGGHVNVQSRPGRGMRITLRLPVDAG